MLCYRCGSHVTDGTDKCPTCGEAFAPRARRAGGPPRPHRPAQDVPGAFKPGERIGGRYDVRSILADDPTGVSHKALDTEIEVEVAVKVFSNKLIQSDDERKVFAAEAKIVRSLSHPNIIRVYDDGLDGDRPFLVMQHLEGLTLRKIIDLRHGKGQTFSVKELEPIFQQLCAALDYAHTQKVGKQKGIAHGNLKPENVIVLPDLLKVVDFREAAMVPRVPFVAAQKVRGGSERYLAPETVSGQPIGPAADLYALGVIFGEMLTGERYDPNKGLEIHTRAPGVPRSVDMVFKRLTALRPDDRYKKAGHLAEDLSAILAGDVPSHADGLRPLSMAPPTAAPEAEEIGTGEFELVDDDAPPPPKEVTRRERLSFGLDADGKPAPPLPPDALVDEDLDEDDVEMLDDEYEDDEEENTAPEPRSPPKAGRVARPLVPVSADDDEGPTDPGAGGRQVIGEMPTRIGAAPSRPAHRRSSGAVPPPPASIPPPPPARPVPEPSRSGQRMSLPLVIGALLVMVAVGTAAVWFSGDLRAAIGLSPRDRGDGAPGSEIPSDTVAAGGPADGALPADGAGGPADPDGAAAGEADPAAGEAQHGGKVAGTDSGRTPAADRRAEADARRKAEAEARRKAEADARRRAEADERRSAGADDRRRAEAEAEAEARRRAAAQAERERAEQARQAEAERRRAAEAEARRKAEEGRKVAALTPTPGQGGDDPSGACPKGMIYVPAGAFKIGSAINDPMRNFAERSLADVDVPAFCVDRYEYGAAGGTPTLGVTWYQAKELCEKRGRRLCSEEEWEKACKGPHSYRFPYGNVFDPEACNTEDAEGNDRAVGRGGTFKRCRSGYGARDMAGNVAEWTSSKFQANLSDRTQKGGAANRPDWDTRCATRANRAPNTRDPYLGFRCCSDPK